MSGPKRRLIQAGLAAAILAVVTVVVTAASAVAGGLSYLFGGPFWRVDLFAAFVLTLACAVIALVIRRRAVAASTKTIADWPTPGQSRSHVAEWKGENFDRLLSAQVGYARAAISIDERRKDFDRVRWGPTETPPPRPVSAPEMLLQIWFAGNHSDIGGSYDETESRLSDIALHWMLQQAIGVPDGLKVNGMPEAVAPLRPDEVLRVPRLHLHPSPRGVQHCEVASMQDAIEERTSAWWVPVWVQRWAKGRSWEVKDRDIDPDATVHPSVEERFDADSVPQCDGTRPYRPEPLRRHMKFARYFVD